MSRSGYSEDDYDYDSNWPHICWRGAVKSAIRGKRGQAFLRELLAALDALPEKRLIPNELQTAKGEYCAFGAVGSRREIEMRGVWPDHEAHEIGMLFDIPHALAAEIMWENDEGGYYKETPEQRFSRVRAWVLSQIKELAQ